MKITLFSADRVCTAYFLVCVFSVGNRYVRTKLKKNETVLKKKFKTYKKSKFKKSLKKQNVVLIGLGVKSSTGKKWQFVGGKAAKLGLKASKTTNLTTKKTLEGTKFFRASSLFSNSTLTIKLYKSSGFNNLASASFNGLSVLAVKIKNKLYPEPWLRKIKFLSYRINYNRTPLLLTDSALKRACSGLFCATELQNPKPPLQLK